MSIQGNLSDARYTDSEQRSGFAEAVSIGQGRYYRQDTPIVPPWIGKLMDKSRDQESALARDILCDWTAKESGWFLARAVIDLTLVASPLLLLELHRSQVVVG